MRTSRSSHLRTGSEMRLNGVPSADLRQQDFEPVLHWESTESGHGYSQTLLVLCCEMGYSAIRCWVQLQDIFQVDQTGQVHCRQWTWGPGSPTGGLVYRDFTNGPDSKTFPVNQVHKLADHNSKSTPVDQNPQGPSSERSPRNSADQTLSCGKDFDVNGFCQNWRVLKKFSASTRFDSSGHLIRPDVLDARLARRGGGGAREFPPRVRAVCPRE